jgi:hypothetical protein
MSADTADKETRTQTAVYVYGIIPADVSVEQGTTGVGDPPGEIRTVPHGDIAALVSDIDPDRPLGTPDDLMAHEDLLDAASGEVPVLPLRFGSVVTDDDAVTQELLQDHHDDFTTALRELEGRAEYVVKGRYTDAVLREILTDNKEAAQLNEETKGSSEDATRDARIRLGEIINEEISARRERDTRAVGDALADLVDASLVREATHELDAVYTAFLAQTDKADDIEQALRELAQEWHGRVEIRLLGPLAAYDFVGTPAPGE